MANLAGSRILPIYRIIQSSLLPAPNLAKKFFSSSDPVRYIPRRSAQIKAPQTFASLQDSVMRDDISIHSATLFGNHASGSSNFDDISIQNSLSDDALLIPNNIFNKIGECIKMEESIDPAPELFNTDYKNRGELNTISKADKDGFSKTREEVEKVAVGLLAARAMTAMMLRKKLRGKKYPSDIVEFIVCSFKSRGLLNDRMYAESFTRSRWLSSTWGPRRIEHALAQKGVSKNEAEEARKYVFEEDADSDSDGYNVQHGMNKLSLDYLYTQASKQWLRSRDAIIDNRRVRIVRWLRYRGFNWGVTNHILKKLESQYPT